VTQGCEVRPTPSRAIPAIHTCACTFTPDHGRHCAHSVRTQPNHTYHVKISLTEFAACDTATFGSRYSMAATKACVQEFAAGGKASTDQISAALTEIMTGTATPGQIGAFLLGIFEFSSRARHTHTRTLSPSAPHPRTQYPLAWDCTRFSKTDFVCDGVCGMQVWRRWVENGVGWGL
jgi:hypothetical protein